MEADCHLRDLFPEPDDRLPTCAEVGVLNTAAGLIGILQANEALKWLLGAGESLRNRLLTYDSLTHQQQIIKLAKTFIGDLETIWEKGDYGQQTADVEQVRWEDLQTWPAASYQLISLLAEGREPEMLAGASRYQKALLKAPGKKVFYCQYGRHSLEVARQLRGQGIEAFSLVGGLGAASLQDASRS
jgi:rhodanese-related sulfurtransferase